MSGLAEEETPDSIPPTGRKRIMITLRRKTVTDKAIVALGSRPNVFQREGSLVRVVRDEGQLAKGVLREQLAPRIDMLPLPSLSEELTEAAQFYAKKLRDGAFVKIKVPPPSWVVNCVSARGTWPTLRPLRGVVECPVLRPDGSVLQVPGYDEATGLLYEPAIDFPPVPEDPTWEQVVQARDALLEVVCDFPFAQPVHRAAWLAGLLTGFARHAYRGMTPFFLVDGNVRGSGKSMLVDAAAVIATGRTAARTSQAVKEEEEEKRITSIALAGDPLVLIDNINRPFGSGVFDAALTGEEWKGRVLATNTMPRMRLNTVWWGTGNNVRFASGVDTARRTLHIRFESLEENPERRQAFRHPDLLEWVRANRGRLAAAALTILSMYVKQGRADQIALKTWGSFEAWSRLVRQCVHWVGLEDPYAAHEALTESADTTATALDDLLSGWLELCKDNGVTACTARQAVAWLDEDNQYRSVSSRHVLRWDRLRSALAELMRIRHGSLPTERDLGYLLRGHKGRVVNGQRFKALAKSNAGIPWTVETISSC